MSKYKPRRRVRAADAVTALRIPAALLLLFAAPHGGWFEGFYCLGVASDIADGIVARRCGETAHGARLDTACDVFFFAACFCRLAPSLCLPLPLWIACAAVAAWRLVNFFLTRETPHTVLDKITGALLVPIPFLIDRVPAVGFAVPLLLLAAAATCEDTVRIVRAR